MVTTVAPFPPSLTSTVRVNIRLCGSVPRNELESLSLGKRDACYDLSQAKSLDGESVSSARGSTYFATSLVLPHKGLTNHGCRPKLSTHFPQQRRSCPSFAPPGWAAPAQGESRLEPVCETIGVQPPVDLTKRAVFNIGRSPTSDVQLMHATSSRRHALLFHHSNGSCYVVDCASAHGTYVNGVRVNSSALNGAVVPHRVRRGSIIRFGGPGAPSFMLKSFEFDLSDVTDFEVSCNPTLSPTRPALASVVTRNTRFNALGKTAMEDVGFSLGTKRSFDSMETIQDCDQVAETQDMRCTSPLLFEQEPIRLVSPDMNAPPAKKRRVRFSDQLSQSYYPSLISPDVSCDENDTAE